MEGKKINKDFARVAYTGTVENAERNAENCSKTNDQKESKIFKKKAENCKNKER